MEAVRSVSLGIWFRVGSRDEEPQQLGLSHFMEHMMFKGTPSRDAVAISREFDAMGAELNAFTSKEYTCYYARFIDEHIDKATEILSDMVVNSLFEQSAIDSEREVVIEEIARSEDTPDDHVFDLFTQAIFPSHQLGEPILGTREIVGAFNHDDCQGYLSRHYHAGNCTVVASGNVDHDAVVALCEKHLTALRAGERNARGAVDEHNRLNFSFLKKRDVEQAHLLYGMPGIPLGDDDRFAGALLDTALGGGMSSRLFQEIREKRGLAYAVFATTSPYLNAAQFGIYVGTRPSNLEEVVELVRQELATVLEAGLDADELARNKEFVAGQLVLSMESTRNHMTRLGKSSVSDLEILTTKELLGRYRAVTLEDIERVAQRIFSQTPTLAIISPLETEALEDAFGYLL
jgi:predicted Zn-dependent peptidase